MIINAQGGESSSHFDISLVLIVLVSEIFEARFVLSSLHSKLEKSESNKPIYIENTGLDIFSSQFQPSAVNV